MSNTRGEITVLYFAAAHTATGLASEHIPLPNPSVDSSAPSDFRLSQLSELLISRHRHTELHKVLESSQWSVDAEMVENPEEVILKGGEEVAIICPVSGG
jgi:molybdopterin synthase sulfur carrier subunit